MKTSFIDEEYATAYRILQSYLALGLGGVYQQGIDRLANLGVDVRLFAAATEVNAKWLLNHMAGSGVTGR